MRRTISLLISTLAILTSLIGPFQGAAMAAAAKAPAAPPVPNTANNGQALEIAPPVIYLTVNPGQTVTTPIYIRDISSGDLIVAGQANDFVAAGEDGTPKILLNNDTTDPYSLRSWIVVPPSELLVPKEIKTMNLTLNVPTNASPGGHYGVIRFTATPPSLKDSGVSLSASLGALLLVTVSGNIKHNLSVNEFSVNDGGKASTFFEAGPLNFVEKLKNNGNVHEQPTGIVTITDTFGRKLAGLPVNQPPKNVLPDSIRAFSEPLDKSVIGNKRLLGRYTAKLNLTYANKQTLAATMTFWVIPVKLVIGLIIAIIALFFLIRFGIRRYNRYILRQVGGGSPRNSRGSRKHKK